ncbi:hypothetical protein [Cupriavidus gilardii]|uniref:hypothetical protein n=1 Tax=Cupriavidus gilardii TaxID=82541 RepID=UPI001580395F|nr:hypothetical protein [Cupriavidus gilardii]QKS60866.1 hypothetical protein FOB47_02550 [Cupriavidus gilardii]
MSNIIELARFRGKTGAQQPSNDGSIEFEHQLDGTYRITYKGIYARSAPVAAEHLADALLQLTIEIRDKHG